LKENKQSNEKGRVRRNFRFSPEGDKTTRSKKPEIVSKTIDASKAGGGGGVVRNQRR